MRMGARLLLAGAALVGVQSTDLGARPPPAPPPTPPPPPHPAPPAPPPVPPPPPPVTSPQSQVFGKVLSLDDAVAIALETQPNIKARISDYIAAAFRVDQALAPLLPQITGSWTAARDQNVAGGVSPLITTQSTKTVTSWSTTTVARVSLSQILFDFGKNFASTEAARKLADFALEDTELQRQLATQTVKESFTNINFAVRLIQVNQQAVERAELNLRSARGFFEVGTRPKSDVARAEVGVANAKRDLIRARNAERLARVALATAIGLPATTPLQIPDNLLYQPLTLDRARLAEDALRQRPEYRQARLNAEADERIQAAQVAVAAAQENFRLAQGRFDAGVGTILELTDAQLALTQAQNTEAQALADYRIALARLDRAVGRR